MNKDINKTTDIHAKALMLKNGLMSFEEWRKEMLAWANAYLAGKENKHPQDTNTKS